MLCPGYHLQENLDDTVGGMAVPEGGMRPGLPLPAKVSRATATILQDRCQRANWCFRNRDGTSVFSRRVGRARREQWFPPDAPGVGEDERRFAEKAKKIEIADRRDEAQLRVMMNAPFGEALLGARMHGKDDGQFRGAHRWRPGVGPSFRGVHVRGRSGKDGKTAPASAVFQAEIVSNFGLLGDGEEMAK